jgi:DNA-binding response OmpR family regulator
MAADRILIIDEASFSRVCSAILANEGFSAESIPHDETLSASLRLHTYGLVITSYPYGSFLFDEIRRMSLPVIVLTDHISRDLISMLEGFDKSYCMVKPLDYRKFKGLVTQLMNGEYTYQGGYCIV